MADQRKTVLITGVTRGLGRALLNRFSEAGWTVVGCGRSTEAIAALTARFPAPHRFAVCNVADREAVDEWAAELLSAGIVPDLLINNAAVINSNAPLWQVPPEEFYQVIATNVNGVFHVLRAIVPSMVARRRGVIVNLSSGWGRSTSAKVAPYCASKFAVEGLTQALAQELPPGMAAIPLNPGVIDTDMLRSCFGSGAGDYAGAEAWSQLAAPFLMSLGPQHNGESLTVPTE